MKIGNNLDLTKHELQNAVIQNLAAAPSNPKEGQVYYHTGDNTTYIWNGSSWEDALNQGTGGVSDHGALNGLADDDHGQYALTDGSRGSFASTAQGALANSAVQPGGIANFETTTQLNARDTANRNRTNHTGTQSISTITGLQTALNDKLNSSSVVNDVTTGGTNVPLSAQQGVVLKGLIDSINTLLTSDETNLDTLQEIVDYIELNRSDLDALSISSIAGLQTALNGKADTSHTHTSSDITDFDTEVTNNVSVLANTAKVTYPTADSNIVQSFSSGKYAANITGDNTTTSFSITHNLGTLDIISDVWEVSTGEKILVDIVKTSTNALNVVFGTAPASAKIYRLVLIG